MIIVTMNRALIPAEELEAAQAIERNLGSLQSITIEFRQAASLYLFARARITTSPSAQGGSPESFELSAWMRIAGRVGALMAYSFRELMLATNKAKVPYIWSKVDMGERDAAAALFQREFPSIHGIRHSAAHPGELLKDPVETERHRNRTPYARGPVHIEGGLVEAMVIGADDHMIFSSSFRGEIAEYELSMRKADALEAAADDYLRAFYPLRSPDDVQRDQWLRESEERRRQDQRSRPPWWRSLI